MSSSSPKAPPGGYGRFIPREELQDFANWQPNRLWRRAGDSPKC